MKVRPYMMVPLPDELTVEEGASISCGTGTAFMAIKRLNVSGRDTLAIYGQGPVGLSGTMLAKGMGARVIAVDVGTERLDSRGSCRDDTLSGSTTRALRPTSSVNY